MAGPGNAKRPARQEAGGAEPRNFTYRLSQRRQRKRQGRVTDTPAHMPTTLPMNGRVAVRSARIPHVELTKQIADRSSVQTAESGS